MKAAHEHDGESLPWLTNVLRHSESHQGHLGYIELVVTNRSAKSAGNRLDGNKAQLDTRRFDTAIEQGFGERRSSEGNAKFGFRFRQILIISVMADNWWLV